MSEELEKGQRLAAGNFTLTGVLDDGKRQMTLTGYVYSDDTQDEINKRVNAFQDVIDLQIIRSELRANEVQIARNNAGLEQLAAHFEQVAKKKQGGKKLSSQDYAALEKYDSGVAHFKRSNESLRAAIDEGKRKLNGAA